MPGPFLSLVLRDIDILVFCYTYCGCTIEQVRRRFFATHGARSACYARISRLIEAGFLAANRLPSLSGVGSGRMFLRPTAVGRRIVAEALGITPRQLGDPPRSISPLLIAHHLSVGDFRLSVELASKLDGQASLREWLSDDDAHRKPLAVWDEAAGREVPLVPDSIFDLELPNGRLQRMLVEVDRSTVPAGRWRQKLERYLRRAGALDRVEPVLIVCLSSKRQGEIAKWAEEAARAMTADSTIFWLTTINQVSEETVLTYPIWQVVGGPARFAILPSTVAPASATIMLNGKPGGVYDDSVGL